MEFRYLLDGPQIKIENNHAIITLADSDYGSPFLYCTLLEAANVQASIAVETKKIADNNSDKLLKRLHASRRSEMRYVEKRDRSRYLKLSRHAEALEKMLKKSVSGLKIYDIRFRLVVTANHPVKLSHIVSRILESTKYIGLFFKLEKNMSRNDVVALLPPYTSEKYGYIMDSQSLSSMLPIHFEQIPNKTGIIFGVDDISEKPVIIDIFSENSYNVLLFGESGSGKSFLSKLIIRRSLVRGNAEHVLIIDPLGEYGSLSAAANPSTVSVGKGDYIDPLRLSGGSVDSADAVLSMLIQFDNHIEEDSAPLRRDLINYLKTCSSCCFTGFVEYLKRSGASYYSVTAIERLASNVLIREVPLNINGSITIIRTPQFVDRSNEASVVSVLVSLFSAISSLPGRKIVAIDEAHIFLGNEACSVIMDMIVRHSRHYNTSVMSLTQNPDDFFLNPRSHSILLNSSKVFGFRTKSENISNYSISGADRVREVDFKNLMGGRNDAYSQCLLFSDGRVRKLRILCTEKEKSVIDEKKA
ncbi:MAG: DUF87 domain-containing protein [Thermoplasmataceae archaeon]